MPRLPASLLALGLGAAAAVALVACGGEDAKLLPGQTAREITANLETVKQLTDEGDCLGAESAARQVSEQIEALSGVDRKLKQALQGGAERLNEAIAGCEEASLEAIAPAEVPAENESSEERAAGAEEKEAKEFEKPRKQEKEVPAAPEGPKTPPSQSEAKEAPPAGGSEEAPPPEVSPSGGVSPGEPAGEGR
jgi:hypothetical protein